MAINISDPYLLRALDGVGRWARFLAIVSFVFLGLGALGLLFSLGTFATIAATVPGLEGFAALGTVGISVIAVVYLGLFGFLTYKLYRFGDILRGSTARGTSNEEIETAFSNLATMLKAYVILTAVAIAFVLVTMLVGLGTAAALAQ